MKRLVTLFVIILLAIEGRADHITGGEMYYTFLGVANNEYLYKVTLKLFMRCNSGRQFLNPTIVSIFNKGSGNRISDVTVPLLRQQEISLNTTNPCISNPPFVCYDVGLYEFNISLPPSADGYVLASQVNYRIAGISNLNDGYGLIGATYTAEIPGTSASPNYPINHSAHFVGSDLVVVCAGNSMTYSFAAEDADGDELQYSFCDAYQSGTSSQGSAAPPPPYASVPYGPNFSATSPLGDQVKIDSHTGLITGVAPPAGIYVVTVCVSEVRNGIIVATQRKDLQINITACTIAAASLPSAFMLCRNSKTLTAYNQSTSPLIHTYSWQFTNANGNILFTSSEATATYTFADTGTYFVKLWINKNEQCSDSARSTARVYPGFVPAFDYKGVCFSKPTMFMDKTTSRYGAVNSWSWDFGEFATNNDTSSFANPTYTYPAMGSKDVNLIVTDTKGCRDTIVKTIPIFDKPPIQLLFRDTLICIPDAVQLHASGSGIFSWLPAQNILGSNTPSPTVSPIASTTYYVLLDDNGCINKDSVIVQVTDHVDLTAMNDTTICQDDLIQLNVTSNGFQYSWTPANSFVDAHVKDPVCITHDATLYEVTARIGSCVAHDGIKVNTIPYPIASAGADTMICFGDPVRLNGLTSGNIVHWLPAGSLDNANTANPLARPPSTTTYVLTVFDNKGCPKPAQDSVTVTVLPKIKADAGHDTSVVVGQPLQFSASGGIQYVWFPSIGLTSTSIHNPVGVYNNESDIIHYRVLVFNAAGCSDSAFVTVKVFKSNPQVFVPNAFTPNADGHNDVLRPILAGIQKLDHFNVYNKWGQLVFSSTQPAKGWDGRISGTLQDAGTYVWMVTATDYKGQSIFERGVVVLVR